MTKNFVTSGPVTVFSIFFPKLKFVSNPSPSSESTADKLIFNEVAEVNLTCSLPMDMIPEDVELRMENTEVEGNAVYSDEHAIFEINKGQLAIEYNTTRYIGLINVTCRALRNKKTKSWRLIQIEQQYKTQNVKVKYSGTSEVKPGGQVQMECVGDGHPKPKEYEWFNRTKTGEKKLADRTKIMKFTAAKDWSEKSDILCGTKNEHNTGGTVKSEPVTVSSIFVPTPIIEATPTGAKHDGKITYVETAKVSLKCAFPDSTSDDAVLEMNAEQRKPGNPVFTDEKVNFTKSGEKHDVRIELEYNKEKFVPFVEVTCASKSQTSPKSSTVITIEQEYKTNNVKLSDNFENKDVEPGMKVELKCLADGNPSPQYQWYNKTKAGDVTLTNPTSPTFQFMVPTNWSSQSVILCGASNKHNKETIVRSEAVTVSATISVQPTNPANTNASPKPTDSISWNILLIVTLLGGLRNLMN